MIRVRRKFLSVPDVIEANDIPTGNTAPLGIIYKIRNLVSDITSYVYPTSKLSCTGDINTLVNWNNYALAEGQANYVQIEFKHGYVYPKSYSLKGYNQDWCFSKEWYLYGLNEENGEKTLLAENKSEGTTFCSSNPGCRSGNWATFPTDNVNQAFKYFQIVSKRPHVAHIYFLADLNYLVFILMMQE